MLEEDKVTELKKDLVLYANHVENMLDGVLHGLLKKDATKLKSIMGEAEEEANAKELRIDDACTSVIAKYQPTATNLRTILMILKINNDLERMADHVVNMAESAEFLIQRPDVKPLKDIPQIATLCMSMLKDAISAFIHKDTALVAEMLKRDKAVDTLRDQITQDLSACMTEDPRVIERALHLLRISTNLERIADLSTNIGEDVVFMVEGKVLKHPRIQKES